MFHLRKGTGLVYISAEPAAILLFSGFASLDSKERLLEDFLWNFWVFLIDNTD